MPKAVHSAQTAADGHSGHDGSFMRGVPGRVEAVSSASREMMNLGKKQVSPRARLLLDYSALKHEIGNLADAVRRQREFGAPIFHHTIGVLDILLRAFEFRGLEVEIDCSALSNDVRRSTSTVGASNSGSVSARR